MPATDALQPILSDEAKKVVKSFGGWTGFCHSYGLKPWESDDAAEGKQIAEMMGQNDAEESKQGKNGR